jgi:hypothetical protein
MKHLKFLAVAIVATTAMAAMVGAGTASAAETTLCKTGESPCPEASVYPAGTTVKMSLKTGTKLKMAYGFFTFECSGSEIESKITSATNPEGAISKLNYTGCNDEETKVLKLGSLSFGWTTGVNGSLNTSGFEVTGREFGEVCVWGGVLSAGVEVKGGAPASIAMNASVPRVSGSFLCGNPATWTAGYTVTSPNPLYVTHM